MAEKFISDRNLKFLLYEMFDAESLLKYPRYADHSREIFDMVLETAMKMGKDLFKPIFSEMDKQAPEYVKGEVKVHPQVRTIMRECGAGGWIGATLKSLMKSGQTDIIMAKIWEEGKHFGAMLLAPEAKEAFNAFFQKRKPDFTKFS